MSHGAQEVPLWIKVLRSYRFLGNHHMIPLLSSTFQSIFAIPNDPSGPVTMQTKKHPKFAMLVVLERRPT